MEIEDIRLERFLQAFHSGAEMCSTGGELSQVPPVFCISQHTPYVVLISCTQGNLTLMAGHKSYVVQQEQLAIVDKDVSWRIAAHSSDCRLVMLFFRVEEIRDVLGSTVMTMRLYRMLTPEHCLVCAATTDTDIRQYAELMAAFPRKETNSFDENERKLLLMALVYRLCSLFSKLSLNAKGKNVRKMEIFFSLIDLVSKHYDRERGVMFYANSLCLSPKYLSQLSKTICGYTVQEIVFKAIVRRSIFLMTNTTFTISEIANQMHFPNASAFGTFFKKQTGLSPREYRLLHTKVE